MEEDQCHLFCNCVFATKVWSSTFGIFNNGNISTNDNFFDWLESLSSNEKDGLSNLSKVILNCWQIWMERNNLVFRNVPPPPPPAIPARCVSTAGSVGSAFLKANGKCYPNEALPISSFIKLHPPDQHDVIKLNFDGLVSNNRADAAFMLRNSNSQVRGGGS